MSKSLVHGPTQTMPWENKTGVDAKSDDIVRVGTQLIGVLKVDTPDTKVGAAFIAGVFELPKEGGAGQDWVQGEPLYHDATNKRITTTAAGNVLAGLAYEDVAESPASGKGKILLNVRAAS